MEVKQNVNIHNRFDIEVRDAKTGEIKRKEEGYNIVLDQMYTILCAGIFRPFAYIQFGSGTGTPTPDRSSLFTPVGSRLSTDEEIIKAYPVSSLKKKIVLNPEEYVGQHITEIGISYLVGSTSLLTHAMLKDSEGNPISIVKTGTDVITIYATIFITLSSPYENLKFVDIKSNNLLKYLLDGNNSLTGSFGLNSQEISGTRLGSTALATWVSDPVTRQRRTGITRFGIDVANGNALTLDFSNLFVLKFPQVGVFTGQSYADVPMGSGNGVKKDFVMPSAYVKQDSIAIKVNGIPNTDFIKGTVYKDADKVNSPTVKATGNAIGVAMTPDGNVMAAAYSNTPFIETYDLVGISWVTRPNPAILPTSTAYAVALSHDGLVLVVGETVSPFVRTYDWIDNAWVARPDPAILPIGGTVYDISLTPDGLVMAIAGATPPYLSVYDWIDNAWIRRTAPAIAPTNSANGIALTSDGLVMAVANYGVLPIAVYDWIDNAWEKRIAPFDTPPAHGNGIAITPDGKVLVVACAQAPFVASYDWVENAWIRRPNPADLPINQLNDIALTSDGLVMAIAVPNAPYVIIYDWAENAWIRRPTPISLPSNNTLDVAITPDGKSIAFGQLGLPWLTIYRSLPYTVIKFNTPPPAGAVITADYTVEGVHKTNQYVIDVSFAIQFGEGEQI